MPVISLPVSPPPPKPSLFARLAAFIRNWLARCSSSRPYEERVVRPDNIEHFEQGLEQARRHEHERGLALTEDNLSPPSTPRRPHNMMSAQLSSQEKARIAEYKKNLCEDILLRRARYSEQPEYPKHCELMTQYWKGEGTRNCSLEDEIDCFFKYCDWVKEQEKKAASESVASDHVAKEV